MQLTLPERWQGKEVHLYGFAVDYEGNASNTVYIGMLAEEAGKMSAFQHEGDGMPTGCRRTKICSAHTTDMLFPRSFGILTDKLMC